VTALGTAPQVADVVAAMRTQRAHRTRVTVRTAALVLGAALVATLLAVTLGGSVRVSPLDVAAALAGRADGLTRFVVMETRLPRAFVALLAGLAFGVAGSLYQRIVVNPLATPDVIGVSAGAGAGAVLVLTVLGTGGVSVQAGAVVGAVLAVGVVMVLGSRPGEGTYRLVLVGIGVAAGLSSVTAYLLTRTDEMTGARATRWLVGSLNAASWSDVRVLTLSVALGLVALALVGPHLAAVRLGDRVATGLGTRVLHVRVAVLLLGAALAAVAVSVTGAVGFVALVAGPVALRLVPGSGPLLAGVVGAALLAGADLVAQTAPVISPVPTGVVTALVGAPVLFHLLLRRRSVS